jgi:hypothetical protein
MSADTQGDRMNLLRHWTVEDREHLAVVTLGTFELPDRSELVRRITENYVPARHYRGAVASIEAIITHARLDRDERGIAEAERYIGLAQDALDRLGGQ